MNCGSPTVRASIHRIGVVGTEHPLHRLRVRKCGRWQLGPYPGSRKRGPEEEQQHEGDSRLRSTCHEPALGFVLSIGLIGSSSQESRRQISAAFDSEEEEARRRSVTDLHSEPERGCRGS